MTASATPREARSGLPPWTPAELPAPPNPRGVQWIGVVGPGVIVLGLSIGSGEFLLGPAVFVRYGLTLLWVTVAAVLFQTIFNTELMRYTVTTGEPVFTGFMRTRPSSKFWAVAYSALYVLQSGWPAWAATAAGAIFFLIMRRLAMPADAGAVYLIGVAAYAACVVLLVFGRRIERTLELLNWALLVPILSSFLVLSIVFVPSSIWIGAAAGLIGFDPPSGTFAWLPAGVDPVLLASLVAYAGAGGLANVTLSNWARDRGYGMGERIGFIPGAVGGHRTPLAHSGFIFTPDAANLTRWRGWWRIVRADQWGVFFSGGILGMVLPAMLYVTFLKPGSDIRGLAIAAELASAVGAKAGPLLAGVMALLGAWMLFKTQLDQMEALIRALTDMMWTASSRVRHIARGDVRRVYYAVLTMVVIWGLIALRLVQPIALLLIGANVAGVAFVITSLHLLRLNTTLLPVALRPPLWRRVTLVAMSLFYAVFSWLSIRSVL